LYRTKKHLVVHEVLEKDFQIPKKARQSHIYSGPGMFWKFGHINRISCVIIYFTVEAEKVV
jgi:hypothetical protein